MGLIIKFITITGLSLMETVRQLRRSGIITGHFCRNSLDATTRTAAGGEVMDSFARNIRLLTG